MRLVVAGLLVGSLLAVPAFPGAAACRIELHDPTAPRYSQSCEDPENWTEENEVHASMSSSQVTPAAEGGLGDHLAREVACTHVNVRCETALDASIHVDPEQEDDGDEDEGSLLAARLNGEDLHATAFVHEPDPRNGGGVAIDLERGDTWST